MVTMLARLGLKKTQNTAPVNNTKRSNGTPRNNLPTAEKALARALNNIASHHLNTYAKAIRAQAKANVNAARAQAAAAVNPTSTNVKNAVNAVNHAAQAHENVKRAEEEAAAVVPAAPPAPVNNSTLQAEASAVNTVNKVQSLINNIAKYNNAQLTNVNKNNRYNAARKNNINLAIASRRAQLLRNKGNGGNVSA